MHRRREFLSTLALLPLGLALVPARAVAATKVSVTGRVQVRRRKRLRSQHDEVIVYLEGVPGAKRSVASAVHEIRQIDRTFIPVVSAVVKGTTLTFPNDDHIVHNVWSPSPAASFDLGAYKHGSTRSIVVDKPGVVSIYCNMHPEMEASVLVLETNFFAATRSDGSFTIPKVPPGTYTWVAWLPHGKAQSGSITVTEEGAPPIEVELQEVSPPSHRRKDGSHYDEY